MIKVGSAIGRQATSSDGRYQISDDSSLIEHSAIGYDDWVLGVEHPDTLSSIANLAMTYCKQGRWKEGEELQLRVVETSKRVLGVEHPSTLFSMANLTSTYWIQGRWREAKELQLQVIETTNRLKLIVASS